MGACGSTRCAAPPRRGQEVTAPTFRCSAYEPPKRKGGIYGEKVEIDSEAGLILDEFVFEGLVHIEEMAEGYYFARVGGYVFALRRERGKWHAMLKEVRR